MSRWRRYSQPISSETAIRNGEAEWADAGRGDLFITVRSDLQLQGQELAQFEACRQVVRARQFRAVALIRFGLGRAPWSLVVAGDEKVAAAIEALAAAGLDVGRSIHAPWADGLRPVWFRGK